MVPRQNRDIHTVAAHISCIYTVYGVSSPFYLSKLHSQVVTFNHSLLDLDISFFEMFSTNESVGWICKLGQPCPREASLRYPSSNPCTELISTKL